MSLATLGAVSAATNELPLPDTSSLSLGEVLILSGGGGTTEAVVIRSIASGRNIGATVSRGALGTLRLAHATPTTVTIYDPSGGGGGGGVTVEVPPAAPVAVSNIVAPGATVVGGAATLLAMTIIGPFHVSGTDAALAADWVLVTPLAAGALVERVLVFVSESFVDTGRLNVNAGDPVGDDFQPLWIAANNPGPQATGRRASPPTTNAADFGQWLAADGDGLWATINSVGTGEADIYAFIATPAS